MAPADLPNRDAHPRLREPRSVGRDAKRLGVACFFAVAAACVLAKSEATWDRAWPAMAVVHYGLFWVAVAAAILLALGSVFTSAVSFFGESSYGGRHAALGCLWVFLAVVLAFAGAAAIEAME